MRLCQWSLKPCHSPIVPPTHYLTAVRVRLGAPFIETAMICPRCGREELDYLCTHVFCCASLEATRGHNLRDVVLQLTHLAPPHGCFESLKFIPSAPTFRPADILTSTAFPGCLAALDIGEISPDSCGASDDCCETMNIRKRDNYLHHVQE